MRQTNKNTLLGAVLGLLLAFGGSVATAPASHADAMTAGVERGEILAVYEAFKEAQNARDLDRIGSFFIDSPEFLWVSDGQSFYGRERVLARMGSFQRAELWRVTSELDAARVIEVADDVAILHMSLDLEIGREANATLLGFLVSIVFRRQQDDWRIAALLTTREKNR